MSTEADDRHWAFEPGAPIGQGRVALQKLGGGSRYEVYLVWDERLLSLAVAKILRPKHVENEEALRDLAHEADILARLAHPVLLRGFDVVLEPPYPHLLVEHLDGPTLRRLVKRHGDLAPEQLLPLALHVTSVLHYLASEGYVHLDVKPANIVMGVPPRVIDLSIARTVEEAARLRTPIGTDAYMAPEQCDPSRAPVGPAADVWGLGATLFHAIATEVPFPRPDEARDSAEPTERFPQLVEEPRPLPARVPQPLAELVLAMLAQDPAARPTARAVAEGLEPLVEALPRRIRLTLRGVRVR